MIAATVRTCTHFLPVRRVTHKLATYVYLYRVTYKSFSSRFSNSLSRSLSSFHEDEDEYRTRTWHEYQGTVRVLVLASQYRTRTSSHDT